MTVAPRPVAACALVALAFFATLHPPGVSSLSPRPPLYRRARRCGAIPVPARLPHWQRSVRSGLGSGGLVIGALGSSGSIPPSPHSSSFQASASEAKGIRLNKVFKATHSRREADKLIEAGRVAVNGETVLIKGGIFVVPFVDEVRLDGEVVKGWERMNALELDGGNSDVSRGVARTSKGHRSGDEVDISTASFEYVKYFKPLGVTCTTDLSVRGNIIDEIQRDGYRPRHRVYPVGRLDKETTGLIILTSDGRMVNAVLRGERKQPKVYKVMVDGRLEERDLERLRDGIVIKTVAQRKNKTLEENTLVAKTKPCTVERIGPSSVRMTLVEGRNRQIRKMMEALGFRVVRLHRVEFMGIQLGGLKRPGDWADLDRREMGLVEQAIWAAQKDS